MQLCTQPNLSALLSLLLSSPVQRIETPLWSGLQLQSHQLLDSSVLIWANKGWNMVQYYVMQLVEMRGGMVQYFVMQLVQMRDGTVHYETCTNAGWNRTIFCCATCTNDGWNTVQYSFVMQLVQMTSNWSKWGVEHRTIFICYATYTNEVELVQMRGGSQNNEHSKSHFRFNSSMRP